MIFSKTLFPPFARLRIWSAVRSFLDPHLEHHGCICLANLDSLCHSELYFLFLSALLGSLAAMALRQSLQVLPLERVPQYKQGLLNLFIINIYLFYFFCMFRAVTFNFIIIILILDKGTQMGIECC